MKLTILFCLLNIWINNPGTAISKFLPEDTFIHITQQDIPKATAIFWIDKKLHKEGEELKFQTIKVKVDISKEGDIKLISYVNVQHPNVELHIEKHLKEFKVTKRMLDGGYIKPGEQYVQLRYMPGKVKKVI